MPLPLNLGEAQYSCQLGQGEPAADVQSAHFAWGARPFHAADGSAGSGFGMAATAAARTAARDSTPSGIANAWCQEEELHYEIDEFSSPLSPLRMPPRGSSGLSSAPNLLQKSHSNTANDSIDSGSWPGQSGRNSARRKGVTLYGGKTELFGRVYDSTPTNQVFMEDIVNRGKSEKGPQCPQRPTPRPAPDFRQTEAWQRAYASRQRSRQSRQPAGERPRVSVPRSKSRIQPRSGDCLHRGGQQPETTDCLQTSSSFVAMDGSLCGTGLGVGQSGSRGVHSSGSHRHGSQVHAADPEPKGLPPVVGWPWKVQPWNEVDCDCSVDVQALSATASLASARRASHNYPTGSEAPSGPAMSSFPRSRSLSPEMDPMLGMSTNGQAPMHHSAGRAWCDRPPSPNDVPMIRPPSTHDVPLKEMQRLLGETWRYQQLGDLAVAASAASAMAASEPGSMSAAPAPPLSPVSFSHSDRSCAPPPICSDLVEVRAMQGEGKDSLTEATWSCAGSSSGISAASTARPTSCASTASTPDTSKLTSPEYVFLGRLVATLPGEEAGARTPCQGPSTPQAVVECNFWQLREALGMSPRTAAYTGTPTSEVRPPVSCGPPTTPSPLLGVSPPRPLSFSRSAASLMSPAPAATSSLTGPEEGVEDDDEDEELPPWPHEM